MKIVIQVFFCSLLILGIGCISFESIIKKEYPSRIEGLELLSTRDPLVEQTSRGIVLSFAFVCWAQVDVIFPATDYYEAIFWYKDKESERWKDKTEVGPLAVQLNRNSWYFVPGTKSTQKVYGRTMSSVFHVYCYDIFSLEDIKGLVIGIPIISVEKIKKLSSVQKITNHGNVVYFELIKDGKFTSTFTPLTLEQCRKDSLYYDDFNKLLLTLKVIEREDHGN